MAKRCTVSFESYLLLLADPLNLLNRLGHEVGHRRFVNDLFYQLAVHLPD